MLACRPSGAGLYKPRREEEEQDSQRSDANQPSCGSSARASVRRQPHSDQQRSHVHVSLDGRCAPERSFDYMCCRLRRMSPDSNVLSSVHHFQSVSNVTTLLRKAAGALSGSMALSCICSSTSKWPQTTIDSDKSTKTVSDDYANLLPDLVHLSVAQCRLQADVHRQLLQLLA